MKNKIIYSRLGVFVILLAVIVSFINVNDVSAFQFGTGGQVGIFYIRIAYDSGHSIPQCSSLNNKQHIHIQFKKSSTDTAYIANFHIGFPSGGKLAVYEENTNTCTSISASLSEIKKMLDNVGGKRGYALGQVIGSRYLLTPMVIINPIVIACAFGFTTPYCNQQNINAGTINY